MSEQSSDSPDPSKVISFLELIRQSSPNIMKGISDYGSFREADDAIRYLGKLHIVVEDIETIDKIFVKDKANADVWASEQYKLVEEERASLCSLLETALDIARSIRDTRYEDYKACLQIKIDETSTLCMRLDAIIPAFEGDEGVAGLDKLDMVNRYEVILTAKPELVDWTAHNLYE